MLPHFYFTTITTHFRFFIALLGSLLLQLPAFAQVNQGLVPDTTEARVLRQFYVATQGDTWTTRTNWNQGTTAADFATWHGVQVSNGDVWGLSLYNNNLQGTLPTTLPQLTGLQSLYLPDNRIRGNLPATWAGLTQLNLLHLGGNRFIGTIPAGLGQLPALAYLHLGGNLLSGTLPPALGQLTQLQEFNGSSNQFTGPLPLALGQCLQLRELNLFNNQLSGSLPAELSSCTNLQGLNLSRNQLSGPLPLSWDTFPQLRGIDLNYNQLSGSLPPGWGNSPLRAIGLGSNRFSGPLPASWGQLGGLQHLNLGDNRLTGPIPVSWGQLTSLTQCFLNNNQLSGPLPVELSQLGGLNYLDLHHNRFTGNLPRRFNRLRQLSRLQLANNQLSGTVPDSLQATYLILDNNHFSGSLPATLGFYQLTLNNNDLTAIPDYGVPLGYGGPIEVHVGGNYLDFASLEVNQWLGGMPSQRTPGPADTVYVLHGTTVARTRTMGGTANHYQWQRLLNGIWVDVLDEGRPEFSRASFEQAMEGEYRQRVTSDLLAGVLYTKSYYFSLVPYTPLPFNEPLAGDCPPVRDVTPAGRSTTDPVNYVRTYSARAPFTDPALLRQAGVRDVQVKTEYLDGLGRPVQSVLRQESPNRRDLVQPIAYDALGRSPKQYLPYTVLSAADNQARNYRDNALREQYVFHHGPGTGITTPELDLVGNVTSNLPKTGFAYGETAFEPSPLNRPRLQSSPGESWQLSSGHAQQLAERPSMLADDVRRWRPGYGGNREDLLPEPVYAAGELWVKRSTDEQGQVREEFTDKEGRVVLVQVATAPVGQAGGTVCKQVSEGNRLDLDAPPGMVITSIQRATYGAGTGPLCTGFVFTCSADVTTLMEQKLQQVLAAGGPARVVSLEVKNDELGDPCPGYGKWLQVVATYGPAPTPAQWLRTYYVYDDFSRLRAVVPPLAVERVLSKAGQVDGAGVERLLFRYHYDADGRLVEKKVPDTDGYAYTVYDELDRPILTQDVAQRARGEWVATKYDALGRVVYTALAHFPDVTGRPDQIRTTLQQRATDAATVGTNPAPLWEAPSTSLTLGRAHYTHAAFPKLEAAKDELLSIAYYDDYDFDENGTADASYSAPTATELNCGASEVPVVDLRVTGQATRSEVRVLGVEANTSGAWLVSTTFFDEKLRPIQVQSLNARGLGDVVTTRYDFVGKVQSSYAVHHGPSGLPAGLSVREQHRYDHAGRLQTTTQELAGASPQVITRLRYNELGQVEQKLLGGTLASIGGAPVTPPAPTAGPMALQTVDYRYNIRGWLTDLNDVQNPDPQDLWSLSLRYNCGFNTPQFNGNIAGQTWRSASDGIERAYGYRYDNLSRLLQGDFVARSTASPTASWSAERSNYRFWGASYDAGGNLLTLRRRGLVQPGSRTVAAQYAETDNLRYTYTPTTNGEPVSNRLQRVDDRAPLATAFGTKVPERPDFSDGATSGSTQPDYTYDATGSLTADRNKNITRIQYNYLHLPQHIAWANGDSLVYRYTASGQKVTKLAYTHGQTEPVRTDYLGPWQYEKDSLRWLSTSEGRALALYSLDPAGQRQLRYAYEYTLKDHLGNLRVAFRPGERHTYITMLDSDPGQTRREQRAFDSVSVSAPIRQVVGMQFARGGDGVALLNAGGTQPRPLGPLKQLVVSRGDTVDVTAFGMYQEPVSSNNWAFSLAGFVASLLQQQAALPPPSVDGRPRPVRVLPLLSLGLGAGTLPALQQLAGGVPQAYLRVLVFNADSTLVDSRTVQLTSAARGNYERLALRVIVPQLGYVTAYVGNESDTDVFFDDVMIEHRQGLQVQENHYDPYGLDLAGVSRQAPGLKELNQYTWNGKEKQQEFGLNWQDHGWRFFDPQLGRWVVVDPDAEEADQESWSTYQFGMDNAVRYNDQDGRCPICPFLPYIAPIVYEAAVVTTAAVTSYFTAKAIVKTVDAVRQAPPAGGMTAVPQKKSPSGMTAGKVDGRAQPGGMTAAPSKSGSRPGATVKTVPGKTTNGRVDYSHVKDQLDRNKEGFPLPDVDAEGPHTTLGVSKSSSKTGGYNQAAEFDATGQPVKEIDFTDHGSPGAHSNPHQHPIDSGKKEYPKARGKQQPLN